MFKLYSFDNKIPKEKYDIIYRIIIDNYFDRNKNLISKKNEIDTKDAYNNWVNTILNTKDYNILLYYLNNKIIGFTSFMYEDNKLCLSEVQFSLNYKNKGYLRKMLKEVINLTDKTRYEVVYGTINKNNFLSKDVFMHIGFKNIEKNRYEISLFEFEKWLNN